MDVLAAESPVCADDFIRLIAEVTGVRIKPEDLNQVLHLLVRQRSDSLRSRFGLVMQEQSDGFGCWLVKQDSGAGVYFRLYNKPWGIVITGARDLGGSRRCGMPLSL